LFLAALSVVLTSLSIAYIIYIISPNCFSYVFCSHHVLLLLASCTSFRDFSHISQLFLAFLLVSSSSSLTCFFHLCQSLLVPLSVAFNLIICFLFFFYLLLAGLLLFLAWLADASHIAYSCFTYRFKLLRASLSVVSSTLLDCFLYSFQFILPHFQIHLVHISDGTAYYSDTSHTFLVCFYIFFSCLFHRFLLLLAHQSVAFRISISCFSHLARFLLSLLSVTSHI
jgi:hypothetical protein